MLVLDNSHEGRVAIGVVDDRDALEIAGDDFALEPQRAVLELAEAIVEEFVEFARVNRFAGESRQFVRLSEIVDFQFDVDPFMVEHVLEKPGIAADRDPLKPIVEVAIVERGANWNPADDRGRQFGRIAPPLLMRVAANEYLVELFANLAENPVAPYFSIRRTSREPTRAFARLAPAC